MTSTPTRPVDNVVIATKCLQDRNINIIAGTTVENKGKLILIGKHSLLEDLRTMYPLPNTTASENSLNFKTWEYNFINNFI